MAAAAAAARTETKKNSDVMPFECCVCDCSVLLYDDRQEHDHSHGSHLRSSSRCVSSETKEAGSQLVSKKMRTCAITERTGAPIAISVVALEPLTQT